jgi:hypothetical protein
LWNGIDGPGGINYSVELNEATSRIDTVVLDGPDLKILHAGIPSWDIILSCGRLFIHEFGGLAIISSHELIELARQRGIERPELAAYAAFWNIDHNSIRLPNEHPNNPVSVITARTWEEVDNPNLQYIAEAIKTITSVLNIQQIELSGCPDKNINGSD